MSQSNSFSVNNFLRSHVSPDELLNYDVFCNMVDSTLTQTSKAKNWVFTLNNYTEEELQFFQGLHATNKDVLYVLFGREVGEEGTPHLQGMLCFSKRFTMGNMKRLNPRAHFECTRRLAESVVYCKKDNDFFEYGQCPAGPGTRSDLDRFKDDVKQGHFDGKQLRENHSEVLAKYPAFCLQYVQDHLPEFRTDVFPLFPWQQQLYDELKQEPDNRTITFVVDLSGNNGKSWFAHYYVRNHLCVDSNRRAQVILPGKKTDMAHVLDPLCRVFFFDCPRSKQGEFIQYDFLEDIKNGYVLSSKYWVYHKKMDKSHVVVFMNEDPDMTKLSADRYHIIRI